MGKKTNRAKRITGPAQETSANQSKVDFASTPLDEHGDHIATAEFPYDQVFARLDGEVPDEPRQTSGNMGEAMASLLDWLTKVDLNHRNALRAIGLRTVAMAWVTDPSRFSNASVRTLAKKLGFTAANISPLTAEFSRQFKISNQFQNHDWRKEKP